MKRTILYTAPKKTLLKIALCSLAVTLAVGATVAESEYKSANQLVTAPPKAVAMQSSISAVVAMPTPTPTPVPTVEPTIIPTPVPTIIPTPAPTLVPVVMPAPVGSAYDWYIASGINQPWDQVNELVRRESGWNPSAVNKSSGACGLGQQLPCGKWAHQWNDPVGGLIDMNQYVLARYGSWQNAINHHNNHNWY